MVVITNDYLNALSAKLALFHLVGVPYLNQKAREVPPQYKSLSTTGLYILFTPRQVYFWVGAEYFSRYVEERNRQNKKLLISDGLYLRLTAFYRIEVLGDIGLDESDQNIDKMFRKAKVEVEGEETKKFIKVI